MRRQLRVIIKLTNTNNNNTRNEHSKPHFLSHKPHKSLQPQILFPVPLSCAPLPSFLQTLAKKTRTTHTTKPLLYTATYASHIIHSPKKKKTKKMALLLSDALRQAFMPKHEYENLREEDKAWHKLQRPLLLILLGFIFVSILVSTVISLYIVFPVDPLSRPFCNDLRIQPLPINITAAAMAAAAAEAEGVSSSGRGGGESGGDLDIFPGAFYLTDQETVDYYWMVVFVPSTFVFVASVVYLVAGENPHGEFNLITFRNGWLNYLIFVSSYYEKYTWIL